MSWVALMQREYHEQMRPAGRFSGQLLAAFAMAAVFGAGATVTTGLAMRNFGPLLPGGASLHLHAASALLVGTAVAVFMAILSPINLGIDAVAGERERHTLATLAATPLGDAAIVWGKSLAMTAVGCTVAAAAGLVIWIALAILYAGIGMAWGLLAIPLGILATAVPAFCLACMAMAISTRARTVKDAGQRLAFVMMPIMLLWPVVSFAAAVDSLWAKVALVAAPAAVGLLFLLGPLLVFVRFRRHRLLTV